MPERRQASPKQMQFLWNLVQGAFEMQLHQYMPQSLQSDEAARATFQAGLDSLTASAHIEDLIFRCGAVPSTSRVDQAGNQKIASEKQVALYNTIAQELAQMGDPQWTQHQMQGRYSWTVSKWIKKLQDTKERMGGGQPQWGQQAQAQQQPWGQPAQPPAQPQWGQQPAQPQQPQWGQQQAQAQVQPMFDSHGNPLPQGQSANLPFN